MREPAETPAAPAPRAARPDPLDRVLAKDRGALLRLQKRLAEAKGEARAAAQQALEQALARSREAFAAREARLPDPRIDTELPIGREAEAIVELIHKHQVVVIAGETGSGKTTQLPKLCLAAGRGAAGLIGCTQPRRIAARAVAKRVAEELQVPLGKEVGWQVRFTEQVGEDTLVKFMTDGILLAEIQKDRYLSAYDTIIVDEAHERSLNIDFLLGYLKGLLRKRRDLKLIVTSATIDTERFAMHFDGAPVISVEGRSYPVEVRYRPLEDTNADVASKPDAEKSLYEGLLAACDEMTREDARGDVLLFLPGEREIREVHHLLERRKYRETEVLPLYARLSAKDQDRVFNPGPKRRIVLATNVAETSLTVPRIRYVVDPGTARVKRYSPRMKLDRLHIEDIAQASADQRKGRCGRVSSGICYRLFSEQDFNARPRYTDPELLRSSLAGVILRMLSLGLGRVEDFPFIDAPDPRAVADGWQQLTELGAVDKHRQLTPVGKQMAAFAVDVKLARMLIAAKERGSLREMIVIASFLGLQDPRERPPEAREAADRAHAAFADERSEFVSILKLWDAYRAAHEDLSQSKLRDWCGQRFLNFLRLREWRELHRQLILNCEALGWAQNEAPADYADLHRALLAGLALQTGHRSEKGLFDAPRSRKFGLFPASTLASRPPPWVLCATLLDTAKVWGITAAKIEPEWVIDAVPHLLSRRHFDPHWSRRQGRVQGSEQIGLFGLVLLPKKPVHYGGLYPDEAREIFVRQGLVTGEIDTRIPLVKRNLATLERAQEEEAKQRRAGLVVDEDWQVRWYLDRLPSDVHNTAALEAWYGRLDPAAKKSLEWSLAELMSVEGSGIERFPKFLPLGDARLALHYRFEPGHAEDGVTLDVPLHLLPALDAARLSWLVPGLVEEKATELIRGLPKALRRNFVPAPDFARAFALAYPNGDADSVAGALGRFLAKATGVDVAALDFDEAALEPHLRMNLRVGEAEGRGFRVLGQSRSLDELKARFGAEAEKAFAARAGERLAREGLREFPAEPVPLEIAGAGGLPAFPALVLDGEDVALRVLADREAALQAHGGGVVRLAEIALADAVKSARKQLPLNPKTAMVYTAVATAEQLRADLVAKALAALLDGGQGGVTLAAIRDREAFNRAIGAVKQKLFGEAMARLKIAEAALSQYAEIRPKLEAPVMGWAKANLDDLRAQLAGLVHPGFVRETPPEAFNELPRYLKALALRAERALRDPTRDQQRMLEVQPFAKALDEARRRGIALEAGWQALRWDLEELRVSLFAQELGTKRPVSAKRLAKQLEALNAR
ncbi:ATP-dependent RNA helicase HrpA [Silanimonas sp.]|uniref:ATP-dependent RNA helicase HrpA n=1 Tax=Silanimonas sp. TaxID=1929290 RepID=UPI0022BF52C0|nr:ATP-dependent RNA helicase HrpA [Silanimonas sp.]MCZ8164224.1 ATP-dependent RNA helicase HrpA [Silanimonas sp.]